MPVKPKAIVLGEKPQGCQWLQALIKSDRFDIVAGITRKDKSHVWWGGDEFAELLAQYHIPCLTRDQLNTIDYDILFSFVYPFIIEQQWLEKAQLCLNLHEAPMPRYRGCNGYSHCILEDAQTYGTTLHIMDSELDHGDIVRQTLFACDPNETAKELYQRTIGYSTELLVQAIPTIATMDFATTANQCEDEPIHARNSLEQIKALSLDCTDNTAALYQKARALDFMPFEPAYYTYDDKKIYAYIDNSLERKETDCSYSSTTATISSDLLLDVIEKKAIKLTDAARPIILMEETNYCANFAVFQ